MCACVRITARKRAEDEIRKLAHEDSLTGLPNRALLQARLAQALASAARTGEGVGLVLIDLDEPGRPFDAGWSSADQRIAARRRGH